MYPIKQSTALTVPFFVHNASGDAVTGLTDGGFTKRISKGSAAFGAMTVTISELENGWYSAPLSTSHTDTTGILSVTFTHASAKQVNLQFRVHANLPDEIYSDTTAIHSQTTVIESDAVVIESSVQVAESNTVVIESDSIVIESSVQVAESSVQVVESDTALWEAAQTEPTGVPAASASPLTKLATLYMALRNQVDVTASFKSFYDDVGTVEFKKAVSDDGTTYSEGEVEAP